MTRKEVYLQQHPGADTYPDGTPKGSCCCIEGLAAHCHIQRGAAKSRREQCAECWACRYRGTWAGLEPCRDCGDSGKQADRYKPLPFCPQCGRPLRPRSRRQLEKRIVEG